MEGNLAVLIDFENIAAGTEKEGLGRFNVEALMQRVKDKGRILVARSYADWGRFSRFKQGLLAENVTMMELTSHGMQDKNRADIALVVDALELAFTKPYIDTFVVVSGDSDFTPMVQKMRELNKRVIGCGTRRSTSRLLIQACDEFLFYDAIVEPARKKRRAAKPVPEGKIDLVAAFDLVDQAVEGLQRENPEPPLAGIVKQAMLRKSPDFSEADLGFGSFTRFLEAAQEAGYVRMVRDQKSGGYRVDVVEGSDDEEDEGREVVAATVEEEYLPTGTEGWVAALDERGIHPMAAPTRMAVLEALDEVVAERRKRRRKSTAHFAADDVKKKLRRTHPDISLKRIRGILDGMRDADLLMHTDGKPVRAPSAPFTLDKNPEQHNRALMNLYLRSLRDAGFELVDSKLLAELFLGNAERAREVEEAVAWLASAPEGVPDEDLNAKDLDDLLLAEPGPRPHLREPVDAPADEDDGLTFAGVDLDLAVAPAEDAEAAEKPKRRRVRKKKADEETPSVDMSTLDAILEPKG